MTSERMLKKWRVEALLNREIPETSYANVKSMAERILILTQELLDIKLMQKKLDSPLREEIRRTIKTGGIDA